MRKGFNGLFALAEHQLKQDPLSGHLFVFCNRGRNRVKILFWDGSGLWVCAKRLERGRFSWPTNQRESKAMSLQQLGMLLDGLEWTQALKKSWFRREAGETL